MAPETSFDASRGNPRFEVDIHVDCESRGMFVSNRVMNISRGGLFIASDEPFPIASEVLLRLSLGDHATIEARGKVIWNYDLPKDSIRITSGSGIRFIDLTPENRGKLERYLEHLCKVQARQDDA
ncbi:MAG: PilZ domain-containing protein [Vicinamibacteria bacterium]|nr:PilZ domain-containing protein [Vicinamibacteria bacterium]